PTNSDQAASGQWFANFSADLSTQFRDNADIYVQWRQRFSTVYLNTIYANATGWKTAIIGIGDQPGSGCTPQNTVPCWATCQANDVVVQNTFLRGMPQMYQSCTSQEFGTYGHVQYWPFEEYVDHGAGLDITFQNARPSPWCLYSQGVTNPKTFFPPQGNCFPFVADEWMTFQVHIHTGPLLLDTDGNYVYRDSHVDLWVGRA